jgi:hypothetical protein
MHSSIITLCQKSRPFQSPCSNYKSYKKPFELIIHCHCGEEMNSTQTETIQDYLLETAIVPLHRAELHILDFLITDFGLSTSQIHYLSIFG